MPKVPLAQAQPGQKLARAVSSPSGVVMVQPGTELTRPLIERLRGLGVDSVVVATDADAAGDRRPLEERIAEVDARFAGHEQDPLMMQIKDVVTRQLQRGDGARHD